MAIKFGCRIGFHNWGPLGEIQSEEWFRLLDDFVPPRKIPFTKTVQYRTCKDCGKLQRKEVK